MPIKPSKINKLANGLIQYCFEYKKKTSIDDVENAANEFCRAIHTQYKKAKLSGFVYFSYFYHELGHWMPSEGVKLGTDVRAYDPAKEYATFSGDSCNGTKYFDLYIRPFKSQGGIDDTHNDCFFDCLYKCVGGMTQFLPVNMRTRSALKKALGLARDDFVGIEGVKQVDKLMLSHKINVSGDMTFTSGKNTNLVIQLILKHEHFTVVAHAERKTKCVRHRINKDCKIYAFKRDYDERTVSLYDGTSLMKVSFKEFTKMDFDKSNYILIIASKTENIQDTFNDRVTQRNELLKASDGKIDIFHYNTLNDCVKDTFKNYSKALQEPEEISDTEAKFLSNAFGGGLMYAEQYEGEIHGYDANSFYPSILVRHQFQFPVRKGNQLSLTQEDFSTLKYYKYGVYRCSIEFKEDTEKLFRYNNRGYYTHFDLTRAKELGLTITLECDGQVNIFQYERSDLVSGDKVFSNYVNLLYPLKLKYKYDIVKFMLNSLWGLLCEKNTHVQVKKIHESTTETKDDEILEVSRAGGLDSEYIKYTFMNQSKLFKTNYARLGCFLTAYARMHLSRTIEPFKEQIKRIHTDGFYLTKALTGNDIDIGAGLGQFKAETKKTGLCKIINVREMTMIQ